MKSKFVKFPFPITGKLSLEEINRWNRFYKKPIIHSRDSCFEEGLWRRTQNKENSESSGWKGSGDARRRMVHYEYRYNLVSDGARKISRLAIEDLYLWWHVCMPNDEVLVYLEHFYASLQLCGWSRVYGLDGYEQIFSFGDLYIRIFECSPENNLHDKLSKRLFPHDYKYLEVTFFSADNYKSKEFLGKPWKILETGIRTKDVRGNPSVNPWNRIQEFFPAQFELGWGPSIEAGIPPLNYLHDVYNVTNSDTGNFVFGPYEDRLVANFISDPHSTILKLSEMYRRCFFAQRTNFYCTIREMFDKGLIVGPIITNNFDGLASRMGLRETFVRRYDETHVIPKIKFHPKAKSLFVVGSHADRRRIQHAARDEGLQVVYVDPEGYCDGKEFTEYPLESPQDCDILFRVTANEFAKKVRELIL